ncbi:MAG: helicase-related protein [Blastocatellia bacterium]
MSFAVGALVRARDREWVVLPGSEPDLLMVRPLGGTEEEATGLLLNLEPVTPARFELPDPARPGDYRSSRLLRDAVRLGFRSSAGPFRSFARLAVEPRPYQLVPLLLALKLDPVRMLIADDVGIGKTIEACLIARELLDRGEIERLAVLCSPQLASQWQNELRDKFHIEAEVVLPGTATRLERNCRMNESLFDRYPFLIVSTDFIKSDRRRAEFQRTCPEFVIVDEAHTCAQGWEGRGGRHQRYELLKAIAQDAARNLVLVTATPHSGNETAFRSLLTLLNPEFADLPDELMGPANEPHRRRLAAHFIQRKRGDLRQYLDTDTPFPDREEMEQSYKLSKEYKQLFDRVLEYARDVVRDESGQGHRQRVRWWSVLALLRSLASSPAAAAATLRTRAAGADTETIEDADSIGRRTVLDLTDDESTESADLMHGSDLGEESDDDRQNRRRLLEMAREAESLKGAKDQKLQNVIKIIGELVKDGFRPILFCRFIPTAEYVAEELRKKLRGVEVVAVTGSLPATEREERVRQLAESEQRILVCTDCLSEGINLQDHFDAVIHYDLSWNPTRHEQREGRVDRYGQEKGTVRVLTYYGLDNQIDGIVLNVLIRKHKTIRGSLGISVPVPVDTDQVIEAIFEGLLLRGKKGGSDDQLLLFEDFMKPRKEELYGKWDEARRREEKLSQTMFSHRPIKVEDVARELRAVRAAIGSGIEVASFTREALRACRATVTESNGASRFDLSETSRALKESLGVEADEFTARFELPVRGRQLYLNRTHPIVEGLATYVMDTALDPLGNAIAHRCGVIRTGRVARRTTLLLLRLRYHIITRRGDAERPLLAEDCLALAFAGAPGSAEWLDAEAAESLLAAEPDANISPEQQAEFLRKVIDDFDALQPHLDEVARQRGEELLQAHRRVRLAAQSKGVSHRVETQLPPDVPGVYIYLPAAK